MLGFKTTKILRKPLSIDSEEALIKSKKFLLKPNF